MTDTKTRLNGQPTPAIPLEPVGLQPLKPKLELHTGTIRLKIEECPLPLLSSIVKDVLASAGSSVKAP